MIRRLQNLWLLSEYAPTFEMKDGQLTEMKLKKVIAYKPKPATIVSMADSLQDEFKPQ